MLPQDLLLMLVVEGTDWAMVCLGAWLSHFPHGVGAGYFTALCLSFLSCEMEPVVQLPQGSL